MISAGPIDTVLDDLNGTAPRFPLRHRAPALIFVCQQWHAISSRGAGAKTQVLILSALMVLMARRMSQTACHWKRNAAYGMTSRNDSRNTMFHWFYRENILVPQSKRCRKGRSYTLSKNIQETRGDLSFFAKTQVNTTLQLWLSRNSALESRMLVCIFIFGCSQQNKNIKKRCKNKQTLSKKPEATLPNHVALIPWIQIRTNTEI